MHTGLNAKEASPLCLISDYQMTAALELTSKKKVVVSTVHMTLKDQ